MGRLLTDDVTSGREEVLASALADVSLRLQAEPDRAQTIGAITSAAVETVPGADLAGISLVEDSRVTAEAPTDERAKRLDEIQAEVGEGPCVSALRTEAVVQVDDFAADARWPRFGERAVEMGVRSVLSFQLFVQHKNLGALNMYSLHSHAFDQRSYVVGHLFAQHASVAYAGASNEFHAGEALLHRDVIGQAKGILMQRDNITAQQAFDLLVQASQHANMKLHAVAKWVADQVPGR